MQLEQLRNSLDSLTSARPLLHTWNLRDPERGWRNLTGLAGAVSLDALREICTPLGRLLPRCPDPDMALNNLERFLANSAGVEQIPVLLENRARILEILLLLFSTSQLFSDLLSLNPDYLDMLRVPLRRSPSQAELQAQLQSEIDAAHEDSAVLRVLRRFRQRQMLRIGTNDIIRDRPLEEITRDISRVADVAIEAALSVALRQVGKRFGQPCTSDGQPVSCVVLAFGKHGGEELNYSSDIDLMFVYTEEGATRGKRVTSVGNDEFFARVVGEVVRLLSSHTDRGHAFRVDLRLRPEGHRGPLARSLASTLAYYDAMGRTWERQALIKVRSVAGDLALGAQFLRNIESFVYRKYLSFAEINEIKAIKRRIEQKASQAGVSGTEVKTGHGGIRDIEFTLQFLQLLNGGDLPEARQRNTLLALSALERVGCLTDQEYRVLDDAYRFLRKVEHRLQLLFDLQTHRLPEGEDELRKLALRMGYTDSEDRINPLDEEAASAIARPAQADPCSAFLRDYQDKTAPTRRILDHLLHQTFAGEAGQAEPESDLLLDTNPDPETIRAVLGRYPFRDVQGAYHNLTQLAQESVPFLSTRRCRHFLASIAPALLRAVADTPDPDMALVNLEKVTNSLGAKTVLWELFSFNQPSLKLYVDLCAWSQFLSEILINNPGMIDELLDSLVLNQPRSAEELRSELADLCRGAADLEPILHSFQDKELLRIGVRDILNKDPIQATTAALSDLAEVLLGQIAAPQYLPLTKRYGIPILTESERAGQPSRFAILALGKLGGREMNYHSDLDLMMVYEGDGRTDPPPHATRFDRYERTDNYHFFTELAQHIIKATSYLGPMGRLYQIDMRLRPTGKSGSLVIPLSEFHRYFITQQDSSAHPEGGAQLWERQALTRARIVHGDADFGDEVMAAVAEGAYGLTWRPEIAEEVLAMRERLLASRPPGNLKRGPGGLADVEFLVQLFQIKYGREVHALRRPNTWQALEALRNVGLLSETEQTALAAAYDFLLRVQSRLRIVHNRTLDELPESSEEIDKLARRLGYDSGDLFLRELERHRTRTRELFLHLLERERAPSEARGVSFGDAEFSDRLSAGSPSPLTLRSAAMPSLRDALEAALIEDPDDLATHRAYADYLQEQGDPRGEFIQVQLALEDPGKTADERQALQAREQELLAKHGRDWLGVLAGELLGTIEELWDSLDESQRPYEIRFVRGWLDRIVLRKHTVERGSGLGHLLCQAPESRLLRELILESHNRVAENLVNSPFLTNIRVYQIGCEKEDDLSHFHVSLFDRKLTDLVAGFPRVEKLYLWARAYDPARLFALPNLRHLRLLQIHRLYDRYPLEILASNPSLIALTHLLLHPYLSDLPLIDLAGVRAVIQSPHLQSLTHLQVRCSDLGDVGCTEIVTSGILKRLRVLDLRHGEITDAGARILADCSDLRRLECLDIDRNGLTQTGIDALRRVLGPALRADNQQTPEELANGQYLSEGDFE